MIVRSLFLGLLMIAVATTSPAFAQQFGKPVIDEDSKSDAQPPRKAKPQKIPELTPPADWHTDLNSAKAAAAKSDKDVVLMFSAAWCGACRHVLTEVVGQDSVEKTLEEFEPVLINVDKDRSDARKYGVRGLPTFVFLNSSGKEIGRSVGAPAAPDRFVTMLKKRDSLQPAAPRKMITDEEAFKVADADANNEVNQNEFTHYVKSRLRNFPFSEQLFGMVDTNKSNTIDLDEFKMRNEALQKLFVELQKRRPQRQAPKKNDADS